jgi:hypothetical protein
MSRAAQLFAASLLALACAHPLDADPSIDPGIVDVRSAGSWEDGDLSGTYRVVVRHYGFEEISSSIIFEWVAGDTRESPAHLIHSVVFADALLGSVGINSLRSTDGGVEVVLVGTLHNGSPYRCLVVLHPGGTFSKGRGC